MLFTFKKSYSQDKNYNCYIKNLTYTSPSSLEFDIIIEWTGTNTQKLTFFQGGINFNYEGMSNGGIITGLFKPGSASKILPVVQQKPNWNINQTSKKIRLLSSIAMDSVAVPIPPSPGFSLGTFVMTNTVPFSKSSKPDFVWSFLPGNGITKTQLSVYFKGSKLAKDVTVQKNFYVKE